MARRVSPVERIRAEIHQLFSCDHDLASILEDVARLSVRLVLQTALEAEVAEFLGRARYERRDDTDRPGSRNGHQPPMTVKTTMGAVQLQRPKLRGTDQAFCSRLFGAGVTGPMRWSRWSSPGGCVACRTGTSRPPWPRSSAPRPRCRSRPSAGSARRSVRSSPPGAPATCPGCGWTTYSLMPAISRCTRAPRPSRSWPPGASMSTASRCSWGWRRRPRSPLTPGTTSWPTSKSVACGHRC